MSDHNFLPHVSGPMLTAKIAPSIMTADFANLGDECKKAIAHGADWIHVGVMDNHFVPNLTVGIPVVACLRRANCGFLDIHLMVLHPEAFVEPMRAAGADQIIFHVEAATDAGALIKVIHAAGMRAGMALLPETPVETALPYLDVVDVILVLAVSPGFSGQMFNPAVMDKVRTIRALKPLLDIEVEGGINVDTVTIAAEAGANCIATGAFFRSDDPGQFIHRLREAVEVKMPKAPTQ
jgi:ribulose-phosphate 3-epimerase